MSASDSTPEVLGVRLCGGTQQPSPLCLSQIADLTTELADEHFKGDVSCQVLERE